MKKKRKTKPTPTLRFSPTAWAKLLFLRDLGETEVGGFGIASDDDPLFIEDVQIVLQTCTVASVLMDDASVADFFDQQVDTGRRPDRFARIWIHTHPGDCPLPSMTDEETFDCVFGRTDWALMFILARNDNAYARLRINAGLALEIEIPIEIDYTRPFAGTDFDAWEEEYWNNVQHTELPLHDAFPSTSSLAGGLARRADNL